MREVREAQRRRHEAGDPTGPTEFQMALEEEDARHAIDNFTREQRRQAFLSLHRDQLIEWLRKEEGWTARKAKNKPNMVEAAVNSNRPVPETANFSFLKTSIYAHLSKDDICKQTNDDIKRECRRLGINAGRKGNSLQVGANAIFNFIQNKGVFSLRSITIKNLEKLRASFSSCRPESFTRICSANEVPEKDIDNED